MHQCLCLIGDGIGQSRMRVPEGDDADAGEEVEVLVSIDRVEKHALARSKRHLRAAIRLDDVLRFGGHDVGCRG